MTPCLNGSKNFLIRNLNPSSKEIGSCPLFNFALNYERERLPQSVLNVASTFAHPNKHVPKVPTYSHCNLSDHQAPGPDPQPHQNRTTGIYGYQALQVNLSYISYFRSHS